MPLAAGSKPESSANRPQRIALIGFMGSGKTTVGRLVAGQLGYRFLDLDVLIEENAGKSIREIFDQDGEEAFRRIESDTLYSVREMNRLVIATGGGAPVRQENQEFFENLADTFYLEVSFEEFLARTGRDRGRPLLDRSIPELKQLYAFRLPIYRALGRCVTTDAHTPQEIAAWILSHLSALR